jgi:uncharacterized cupin superfamily protein
MKLSNLPRAKQIQPEAKPKHYQNMEIHPMPEIKVQHQCATLTDLIPTDDSFGEPIGALPKQTDSSLMAENNLYAGTWECQPGTLKLDLEITEFCHLLEGHWILTSESGQVTEVKAGDSWVFPNGWKGTAEVVEKVRKVYLMIAND